jgi:hypothetical protein
MNRTSSPARRQIPPWASSLLISLASLSRLCRAAPSVVALRRGATGCTRWCQPAKMRGPAGDRLLTAAP